MTAKCPVCGAPMESDTCGYCGYIEKKVADSAAYMQQPIQPQVIINNPPINNMGIIPGVSKKSKTVALLLCIFSGYLGVHKFYVGKVGGGILYLLTFGIFGIGWLIDIILIATGSFKDDFGLPLRQ